MVTADILLKLKQRINKKDTSDYDGIPVYELIEAFNKAQLNVIHRLYQQNNPFKSGFEATRKRVDDLKILIPEQPVELSVSLKDGFYITESFPDNYFHYISSTSKASTPTCSSKKLRNFQVEESNINTLLDNEAISPSFEWGETLVTLVSNKMKVYINKNEPFTINKVYLNYMMKPISIDYVGYQKKDGSDSTTIDSNLPDEIIEMCIDEAARIISGDIQNEFGVQMAQQNIQMSE